MRTRNLLVCVHSIDMWELEHSTFTSSTIRTPTAQTVGHCRQALNVKIMKLFLTPWSFQSSVKYLAVLNKWLAVQYFSSEFIRISTALVYKLILRKIKCNSPALPHSFGCCQEISFENCCLHSIHFCTPTPP